MHNHEGKHSHKHHDDSPPNYSLAFAVGALLNLSFVAVEALYGVMSHSLSLVADAGHNMSDVLGLLVAWAAATLNKRSPTKSHTYGYRSSSILAALFNSLLLLLAVGAIAWEAIRRFNNPELPQTSTMIGVALVGIIINTITAYLFRSGKKGDLNIRGAYLHMIADATVSAGVVVAALIIKQTSWHWVDPAMSLIIVAVILLGTWGLLKDSINLALNAVPEGINADEVKQYLQSLNNVQEVHDLHIWGMSTTEVALTAHLVLSQPVIDDELLAKICRDLKNNYKIDHSTVQLETKKLDCKLAPEHVV